MGLSYIFAIFSRTQIRLENGIESTNLENVLQILSKIFAILDTSAALLVQTENIQLTYSINIKVIKP